MPERRSSDDDRRETLERVVRAYFDACNESSVDGFNAVLANDAIHYFPPGTEGPYRGKEAIAALWLGFAQEKGSSWTIDRLLSDGNEVVVEWSHFKSRVGELIRGAEWYQFDRDGKIVEIRAYYASPRDPKLARNELDQFPYAQRGYPVDFPKNRHGRHDTGSRDTPAVSDEANAKAMAWRREPSVEPLSDEIRALLSNVSTATITTQLFKRGLRSRFMQGVRPRNPDRLRLIGVARTLRYIPMREDLDTLESWATRENPQRRMAEEICPGEVLVIDGRGELGCGTMGSILAARMMVRGAAGMVTDGAYRDGLEIGRLEWPIYSRGMNANTNLVRHHVEDADIPIGCGGVLVCPGDVVVGDADGVVVIPRHLAEDVAEAAARQEKEEAYIQEQVLSGASIVGLYPMNAENRERYRVRQEQASVEQGE